MVISFSSNISISESSSDNGIIGGDKEKHGIGECESAWFTYFIASKSPYVSDWFTTDKLLLSLILELLVFADDVIMLDDVIVMMLAALMRSKLEMEVINHKMDINNWQQSNKKLSITSCHDAKKQYSS